MNIKNNKRRQETIKRIEDTFLAFLEQQELSKIKVSALCEQAGINRGTFYANFEDIYDLADHIKNRLKDEVNRLLTENMEWQYSEADFLKLFEHIRDHRDLYAFYFKLGYDADEDLTLYDVYPHEELENNELLDYHIAFFKSGFNTIVKKWLKEGCRQTPQQMRDVLSREYRGRFQ